MKILIIEDDNFFAKTIIDALDKIDPIHFSYYRVNSLKAADQYLQNNIVDITLLDLGLDDSFGINTYFKFHGKYPSIPVVVITSLNNENASLELVSHGAQDYIIKKELSAPLLRKSIYYAIQRKKYTQKIAQSEEIFRKTFEYGSFGQAHIDTQGNIIKVNQKLCDFLEIDKARLLTSKIQDFTKPESTKTLDKIYNSSANDNNDTTTIKLNFKTYKGKNKIFDSTISPIKNESGDIEFYFAMFSDITIQIRSERALSDTQARLRAIIEGATDIILLFDEKGIIHDCNSTFLKSLGLARHEVIGKNGYDFYSPELAEKRKFNADIVFTTGKPRRIEDERNGRHFDSIIYPIFDENGKVALAATIVRDVTEQKVNQKLLFESRTQLKEAISSKDKFFSIIAHDFKDPFFGFLNMTKMLTDEIEQLEKPEIQEFASSMYIAAEKLYNLILQLLEWSRLQTGRIKLDPKKIDICDIFESEIKTVQSSADNKNISIDNNLESSCNAVADEDMLKTIARNLLTNAIKFSYKNSVININHRVDGDYHIVSVVDKGVGMRKDRIDKLFNLNSITTTVGTNKEPGSGLGLILCKEFIELNGGSISAESFPGEGSTFSIKLPIA